MNTQNINPPYSFIVVGGGIVGLTIALSLQEAGETVLLLDKDAIGAGASSGNAGHIATEQVYPVADASILKSLPKMLLDPLGPLRLDWRYLLTLTPWMIQLLLNMRKKPLQHIHQTLLELNTAALPAWQRLMKKWQLSDLVQIQGSLLVAEKSATLARLEQQSVHLNEIGVENRYLSATQLHEMEPQLATNQLGGLYYPQTGHVINLSDLISRLVNAFTGLGGEIRPNTPVNHIAVDDDQVKLSTDAGPFSADNVVIACGAYSKKWAQMLAGVTVPLETERGYHLMLPHELTRLSVPVSSADRRFIMTPMQHGLRLAGTVEYAGLDLPANMQRAQNFIPLANPMFKVELDATMRTAWMGFRPTIADSLPVIDRRKNCYFAFGHQHLGLTQAAITAELIKDLHFQKTPSIDCSAFSLNRFSS